MFKRYALLFFISLPFFAAAQLKYHENRFVGGVSGDGISLPAAPTPLYLNMPNGSTIVKGYLFAGRYGNAPVTPVSLNGNSITFNSSNQISPTFAAHPTYGGFAAVHAIDVTSLLTGSVSTYTLSVTPGAPGQKSNLYSDFYLYAEYTHPSLVNTTYTAIFIQASNLDSSMFYNMPLTYPVNASTDVGVALFGGYTTDNNTDAWSVYAEGNFLGKVGEPFYSPNTGEGPMGSFYYHNNTLTGITDDNEDEQMMDKDAVSNLDAIEPTGASLINMEFVHGPSQSPRDNAMWAVFYVNGVACIEPEIDLQDVSTCDNQITLDAGITGQTYSWSTTATTQQITVTASGEYIVTVTDQYGCSKKDTVDVTLNSAPVVTLGNDVTICTTPFTLNAGNPGSTYAWNTGATTQTINVSSAGPYSVTVTDGAGCTSTDIINISIGTIPVVNPGHQTICQNSLPATIDAGNIGSTYSWSTGATTQTIAVSNSGAYYVTVTNASGCSATGVSFFSTNPAPTVFQNSPIQFSSCNGVASGFLYAYVMGSTAPYTFSWSTGITSTSPGPAEPVTGSTAISAPGTYSVLVTDANGCTKLFEQTVAPANEYTYTTSTAPAACGGSTGSATVTVSGGKPNYTYSWYPSGGLGATANGLTAGAYTVQVRDATGCLKNVPVYVSNTGGPTITVDSRTDASCYGVFDGAATISASGGTPGYTYSWSNFYTTPNTTYLGNGAYTILVTDAAGCKTYDTVMISSPPEIILNTTTTAPTCATGGVASVAPTGGAGGIYTYSWSSGPETTSLVSGLAPATYTVLVTDNNGCSKSGTFTISGAAAIALNVATVAPGCVSLGSATASTTGGTAPLTYSWSSGTETTASVSGLASGPYSVTVTDNNGCTSIKTFTVSPAAPNTLAVSVDPTDPTCTVATGSATATGSGGTPSYSYSWSYGGNTNSSVNGLPAGNTYTVTITDFNGCTKNTTFSIAASPPNTLDVDIATVDPASCLSSTGSATATVTGGASAYTYSWSSGAQTTNSVTGVVSGSYTLLVTDQNGCTFSEPFSIGPAPQNTLDVNITVVDPTSCVNSTGNATAVVTGGGSVYTYSWSSGAQTTASVTGVASGSYTLLVTDENGCTFSEPFSIGPAPQNTLNATVNVVNPTSCSTPTGNAIAVVTGGGSTYTYSWSSGTETTVSVTGIASGTYTLLVTDENSCTKTATFTIGAAPAPSFTVTVTAVNPVNCTTPVGSASTSIAGSGTYTYSWSTGTQTTSSVTGVAPGNYSVMVTDNNGCTDTEVFTIGPAPAGSFTVSVSTVAPVACVNPVGSATANIDPPATYTYSWSTGTQTTSSVTGITPGTYSVVVTDNNSCTNTETFTIDPAPSSNIVLTVSPSHPTTCTNPQGSAFVSPSGGGSTFTYSWSSGTQTTNAASGLAPGSYTVSTTDNNGCTAQSTFTINPPTSNILLSPTFNDPTCAQPTTDVTITPSGATTYTYSWTPVSSTTSSIMGVDPGTYSVTVTGNNGCTATSTIVVPAIVNSSDINAGMDQTIYEGDSVSIVVPTQGFYTWTPATNISCTDCNTPTFYPDTTTTYIVTLTDVYGCTDSDTITIYVEEPCSGDLYIPTAFSPNNDGMNDVIMVHGNCVYEFIFRIYNRWGEKVFEATDINVGWDGTYRGRPVDPGVFVYYVEGVITYKRDQSISKKGNITLVR